MFMCIQFVAKYVFGDCCVSVCISRYNVELFSIIFIVYAMHSCLISHITVLLLHALRCISMCML